jgi:Mg2+/Co2+ transporter CorC
MNQQLTAMSEDDSSSGAPETAEKRRSWLERLSSAISGEPSTRDDLVELLRDTHADGLIAADTLRMMEGAIAVSDMTVGDVMVPRAQTRSWASCWPRTCCAAWSPTMVRARSMRWCGRRC